VLLGWSAHRVSAANWAVASMLAAVAGVLLVPIASLDPGQYTLFVIPALGCLLVARMRSFAIVAAAGLVLGMLQSLATKLQAQYPGLPQHGLREGIPFLAIIIALAVLGRRLPSWESGTGSGGAGAVIPDRRWWPTACVGVLAAAAALAMLHGPYRGGLIQSLITALLCCSLVVLTGYVGQISLAQLAFAGVGGFAFAKVATMWGLPLPVTLALASLAAVPLGLLVGIPAVRVRGVQLAVVTLGAGVVVEQFVFNNPGFTGGFAGAPVPPASLAGLNLDIRASTPEAYPRLAFGLLVLLLLAVVGCSLAHLRRTAAGRAMLAVKNNERAAAAVGVDVAATKLQAFVLAAAIAGLTGAVIGQQQGTLSGNSFSVFGSLGLLAVAYVAGIGRVAGAVVAGLLLAEGGLQVVVLERWIRFDRYQLLIVGCALIATAIAQPTGIAGRMERDFGSLRARLRALRRPPASAGARLAAVGHLPPRHASADVAGTVAGTGAGAVAGAAGGTVAGRGAGTGPGAVAGRIDDGAAARSAVASVRSGGAAVLTVDGLTVRRGGVLAVDDLSLTVPEGAIVGLIGPNGAGKTTFIDAVTGFVPPVAGRIRLRGVELSELRPHRRTRAGLARTFQSIELFDELSVADNVRVAADPPGTLAHARDFLRPGRSGSAESVTWVLELLDLSGAAQRAPGDLSNGQRKLVGVARALAARPALVLLDEPAAGLDTVESRELAERLRRVRRAGVSVLLVDHDMGLVLDVCDWVYVLDFGTLIASGPPDVISRDPTVLASYLGEPADRVAAAAGGARTGAEEGA
jgi:ABC-type branched-subunit amino acid transport system ATPase component/ABC-type branched-subunit amino acid transport system permease subunit